MSTESAREVEAKLRTDAAFASASKRGTIHTIGRDCAEAADFIASLSAENERLKERLGNAEAGVEAFADICDELGCERDNEAGLIAAHALKGRLAEAERVIRQIAETSPVPLSEADVAPDMFRKLNATTKAARTFLENSNVKA